MKKLLVNKTRKLRTSIKASAVAAVGFGVSLGAHAEDYSTLITAADTDAQGNVTLVIGAVIGLAILGFGVGHMLGWFRK